MRRVMVLMCGVWVLALAGCGAYPVPDDPEWRKIDGSRLPPADATLDIPGLEPCTTHPDKRLRLNTQQPVAVLAHGCFGSSARFRALAEVFAFHGQQAICFTYNDRDSLMKSSAELIDALELLGEAMPQQLITLIGHSQGGLISRKALVADRPEPLNSELNLQLVTISAPFAGIAAADHCGSPLARLLSLGLVVPMCKLISGDKWYEITAASEFIRQPGALLPQVGEHLKIVTDERNSCRERDDAGGCLEDDYVFSVAEQYYSPVDLEPRADNVELDAGHAEIVGDYRIAPVKLIELLQRRGVMNATEATRRPALQALLAQLYDAPPGLSRNAD